MGVALKTAAGLVSLASLAGVAAFAVPTPAPVYTFCEEECGFDDDGTPRGGGGCVCNDTCFNGQMIDASLAVASGGDEYLRDCFYITGKLQADCVWGIQPKCHLFAYEKPLPCRDSSGVIMQGAFYEPRIAQTNGAGFIDNLPVLSDRTVRIGVAAIQDALDGTINGLVNNGAHLERGEVTVKIFYNQSDDGVPRAASASYTFDFRNGADAGRVAFVIPSGIATVDVQCCNDTGEEIIGWDVDHFFIKNLIPSRFYAVEVVGGLLDTDCCSNAWIPDFRGGDKPIPGNVCYDRTPLAIGWFDKNCNLLRCEATGVSNLCDYPRMFVSAEVDGSLHIAVSGGPRYYIGPGMAVNLPTGDCNFNGFEDILEPELNTFLQYLNILEKTNYSITGSVSLKDCTAPQVNRYPRQIWDEYFEWNGMLHTYGFEECASPVPPEVIFAHGVIGSYCLKISLAEHVDPGQRPTYPPLVVINGLRADANSDGNVNASDLALLLSFWGQPVP